MSEMQKLTGLWKQKRKDGKDYYTGSLGNMKVIIMDNAFKQAENHPDAYIFLAPKEDKEASSHNASQAGQAGGYQQQENTMSTFQVSIDTMTKKSNVIKMNCTDLGKKDFPQQQLDCTIYPDTPMFVQLDESICGVQATITGFFYKKLGYRETFVIKELKLGQPVKQAETNLPAAENRFDDNEIPF